MKVKKIGNEYLGKRRESLKRGYSQKENTDFPEVFDKIIERRNHDSKDNSKTTWNK